MRRFLKLCCDIEEMVAAVYLELASSAEAEPGLKDLWRQMALEEEDHARQIRFASRLPYAEVFRGALIPPEKIDHLYRKAQTLLREVKGSPLKQETALRLSLRMEKEFSVVHASCAMEFADERMQTLFRALASEDERHAEALERYCRRAGISVEESER